MKWWQALKERFQRLVEEYGWVAVGTHFTIFGLTLAGFFTAIESGFEPAGAAAGVGTFWAAYAATQLTKPLRFGLTLVLTPLIAAVLRRRRSSELLAEVADAPADP